MHTFSLFSVNMNADSFAVLQTSAARVLAQRNAALSEDGTNAYTVTLSVDKALQNDRFIICGEENGVTLTAANDCALHAAFGRLMRELRFDQNGDFTPIAPEKMIDFTPKEALRGMYFATHFGNFYHSAPIEKVYEVIEDIAMRGCNSLLVWFDMHHFDSMEDPKAKAFVARLHDILSYANRIGMGGSLTMLSNEAFATSPAHLRASWEPQNGYREELVGHFHIEICPSKEGGIEEILRMRREMLRAFSDLRIDYVVYWPYDQGGCTCEKCAPWGANGYLRLFPHFKKLMQEMMPNAKLVVSTWFLDRFTDGEWDGFYPALDTELFSDVPYLLSFFENGVLPDCIKKHGYPKHLHSIDFPEISMYSCTPWGAYGASHLAAFLQRTNTACAGLFHGGFPYSEGVFEDTNKFIELSRYSGEYEDPFDALRAYVRYEFSCDDEALYEAVKRTETGLARKRDKSGAAIRVQIENTEDVAFVYETLSHYNETLPKHITASRNFRLYYLRALIDYEIVTHDGYPLYSERAQDAMKELREIYYADENTHPWVKPFVGL